MANAKQRARRYRMAVAHARRLDQRREPDSRIPAAIRRRTMRELRQAQRRARRFEEAA